MSACGGTHVSRTGGIGIIAMTGVERFKGGLRVEFVCGGRALRALRSLKSTDLTAACGCYPITSRRIYPRPSRKLQSADPGALEAHDDDLMNALAVPEGEPRWRQRG